MKWRGATVLGLLAPLVLTACSLLPNRPKATPTPAATAAPPTEDLRYLRRAHTDDEADLYAGSAACAPCHKEITTEQDASHHARTLRALPIEEFKPYFAQKQVVIDDVRETRYWPVVRGGQCGIASENAEEKGALPVHFVIGAGHSAHTFFSVIGPFRWLDMRLSYFPKAKRWDFTPGQSPHQEVALSGGKPQEGPRLTACLVCHVTTLRTDQNGPEMKKSLLGVSCERCHGPGKAHIAAVEKGDLPGARAALDGLKQASPEKLTRLCGFCHQDSTIAKKGDPHTENDLPRFQGAALERSACYLKSKALSCVTCHNPHQDTKPNPKRNDTLCLSCHTAPKKACPVNAKSDCVRCHMPAQEISGIPYARYTNHWIKVWKR